MWGWGGGGEGGGGGGGGDERGKGGGGEGSRLNVSQSRDSKMSGMSISPRIPRLSFEQRPDTLMSRLRHLFKIALFLYLNRNISFPISFPFITAKSNKQVEHYIQEEWL